MNEHPDAPPEAQTPVRGRHASEYDIYCAQAEELGWPIKSYDEWLIS